MPVFGRGINVGVGVEYEKTSIIFISGCCRRKINTTVLKPFNSIGPPISFYNINGKYKYKYMQFNTSMATDQPVSVSKLAATGLVSLQNLIIGYNANNN